MVRRMLLRVSLTFHDRVRSLPLRVASCVTLFLALLAATARVQAIEVAGELFVDLRGDNATAGEPAWENQGTLGDFTEVGGDALSEVIEGVNAVRFDGLTAYTCADLAPAGLVGVDPTRSIEVWVYNEDIPGEETLLSWSYRGGPAGTNMSFNYGTNAAFGAVGHWDFPDLGWGSTPPPSQWHHLAYTYDGTTTRVYYDGYLANSEVLGAGVINTHAGTPITLAAQWANATTLEPGLRGVLALARVRVHDGVLTDEQVLANYVEEGAALGVSQLPTLLGTPSDDGVLAADGVYARTFSVRGFPLPAVSPLSPAGATVAPAGSGKYTLTYTLPDPAPASFVAGVSAANTAGDAEAFWTVTVFKPQPGVIEVAEELFVDLDAADPTAGTAVWENQGTLGPFLETGNPAVTNVVGVPAVTFNGTTDYYVCETTPAPEGLTGFDPTRSIEVWVFNPAVPTEETLVSWGHRGGPAGTNMSFNYGTHGLFGAVGHWGAPDLGWNDAGGAPQARQWHHLVYTYDGQETRVYADGVQANSELLGPGAINTHADTAILLAAQWANAATVEPGLRGSLSLGKVRVHDGVLLAAQVKHNYDTEKDDFPTNTEVPAILGAPAADVIIRGTITTYTAGFAVTGFPEPRVFLTFGSPAGATVVPSGPGYYTVEYPIPDPPPATLTFKLAATSDVGTGTAIWSVTFIDPPAPGAILTSGEVFVNVDAADPTAGGDFWANAGTLEDLVRVEDPVLLEHNGAAALAFNCDAGLPDAYQTQEDAPAGLVGEDPTRSIEVWVFNPAVAAEETLLAWGRRGGPDGSNMSFNYGTNGLFGAVGHWGGAGPDLGWNNAGGAPEANQWHHLAYTYDGFVTRVYADGALANSELLGPGTINTFTPSKITLAAQLEPDGLTLNTPLAGTLSLGRVRIHDGILLPYQVLNNYLAEKDGFPLTPPPDPPDPVDPEKLSAAPIHRYPFNANADDVAGSAHGVAYGNVTFSDGEAVLHNDGTQISNTNGQSPPADPPGAYIDLPNGIVSVLGNNASFEAWVTWSGPDTSFWQRIFDFGSSAGGEDFSDGAVNSSYIFLTPMSGAGTLRCGYRDGVTAIERVVDTARLAMDPDQHVVVTWKEAEVGADPCAGGTTVTLYLNGLEVARDTQAHITLSQIVDANNWLGRSQWVDAMFSGSYEEFRIYDHALTAGQVLGNFQAGPDVVNTEGGGKPKFHRGDADNNGQLQLTDAVRILNVLFLGTGVILCSDAADADDNGLLQLTDAVRILNVLFLGTGVIPAPGPTGDPCGEDPTDDGLECAEYLPCA